MNCLPCLRGKKSEEEKSDGKKPDTKEEEDLPVAQPKEDPLSKQTSVKIEDDKLEDRDSGGGGGGSTSTAAPPLARVTSRARAPATAAPPVTPLATATVTAPVTPVATAAPVATNKPPIRSSRTFTFQDLTSATKNFKQECLLGESGFGKVYKGTLADGKVVAVKQLERVGMKPNKEFEEEAIKLCDLQHPNLVKLIGYCVDGDQRLLVYEHMPLGSLKDHLHDLPPGKKQLDWITRMKAAAGAAKAMEYLHEKVDPPVICRNIKSTNVLLDENYEPKLTDYGFVNLEDYSDDNVQQRVVGTVGCAPEYEYSGELTLKSDVYSFGVVLLELITGRKALDTSRPAAEQNLVAWARTYFKDPKRFSELADPMFKGVIPDQIINQAVGVAAMCLQEETNVRPMISDIVGALTLLTIVPPEGFKPSPEPIETDYAPTKKDLSSSSSSSSSDSDSEQDLHIEIVPFTEPSLDPEPEPESEPDPEEDPDWEPEPETEPEPEPEPEPDPDSESDSDSSSDSEPEPEPKPVSIPEPEVAPSHEGQLSSEDSTDSSTGSIYEEDAYSEGEISDEDKRNTSILIKSRSKARTKSTKKKVKFNTEGNDSIKPRTKRMDSSRSKKSKRKYDSKTDDHSELEFTDESDDEFETQRFKSTISRFNADSRTYSGYQDEE